MKIITKSKLIEMANNIIEAIESIISDDSEYKIDMDCRSCCIKDKSRCGVPEGTLAEDIWASELFSLITEAKNYLSNPNSWVPDLPFIAWTRDQELLAQIVDEGDDVIKVSYDYSIRNSTITSTLFLGEGAIEGETS